MIVKFKTGGSGYGLGYVPGEVADLPKEIEARVLTTLVDQKGNPVGQDWRDQKIKLDDLIERGVCVQASKEEADQYQAKNKKA